MILPIVVTALIQTAACVLCVGLGYQMGFREGEKIEREKHIEDDSPIGMEGVRCRLVNFTILDGKEEKNLPRIGSWRSDDI